MLDMHEVTGSSPVVSTKRNQNRICRFWFLFFCRPGSLIARKKMIASRKNSNARGSENASNKSCLMLHSSLRFIFAQAKAPVVSTIRKQSRTCLCLLFLLSPFHMHRKRQSEISRVAFIFTVRILYLSDFILYLIIFILNSISSSPYVGAVYF